MRTFHAAIAVGVACIGLAWIPAKAETPRVASLDPKSNPADNPKFYKKDPTETVITNIEGWSHPTKEVFKKYRLKLTKVELMWNKTFPVFHVENFGADPTSGPGGDSLTPFEADLLRANGNHAYKIVEDSAHDGFVIAYDRRERTMDRELVQDESP